MPTTAIAAAANSLNREATSYKRKISQDLRQKLEFEKVATPRACDKVWSAPNVTAGEFLQAYQSEFTPKGSVNFDAVENRLQKIKIDIQYNADDLEKFYDSWMVEWFEVGKKEGEWSFPKYIYKEVIMPKVEEELNHNAWHGVRVEPTEGTAGTSISSVDGYNKRIIDAIDDGDLTAIATGAWVESTMVSQVEAFCSGIPSPYKDLPGEIWMAPALADMYWRNHRDEFGYGNGVSGNENNELRVGRTGKKIVAKKGMAGSNRIMFTLKGNTIWGTRRGYNTYPVIRWKDGGIRKLLGAAEFYRFYGWEYWNTVFVNDQV